MKKYMFLFAKKEFVKSLDVREANIFLVVCIIKSILSFPVAIAVLSLFCTIAALVPFIESNSMFQAAVIGIGGLLGVVIAFCGILFFVEGISANFSTRKKIKRQQQKELNK